MAEEEKEKGESDEELFELLRPKRRIQLSIQKNLSEMPKKYVILLLSRQEEYHLLGAELVKFFTSKNIPGVYVTINNSVADMLEIFQAEKIDEKKVIFIDALSKMSNEKLIEKENCFYLDSPNDLVELNVALEQALSKIKSEDRFVIIDSVSTLLIYNKPQTIEKFVHSLSGKMHAWGVKAALIAVEKTKKDHINILAQFCDSVIKV